MYVNMQQAPEVSPFLGTSSVFFFVIVAVLFLLMIHQVNLVSQ
jgi:uncharacterized protein YqhQ